MKDDTFRKHYARIVLAIGAMAALGLAGCGPREAETTTVVTTEPATPATDTAVTATTRTTTGTPAKTDNTNAGSGTATGTETGIADTISKKIIRNTQMTGSRVTPVVDPSGVATLNGIVQNHQQKALAEKAARDTAGVTGVENKLEIRPTIGARKPKPPTPPPAHTTKIIVVPGAPAKSPAPKAPKAPKTSPAPPAQTTETVEPAQPAETTEETEKEPAEPTEPTTTPEEDAP